MNIISTLLFFALINLLIFIEIVLSDCGNFNFNSDYNENMTGAPMKTDPNSKDVKKIEEKLMNELNTMPNIDCKVNINETLQVYSQVVAGMSTTLKMKLCPYDCLDKTINTNHCKICTATVWEKPWENYFNVTCFSCD